MGKTAVGCYLAEHHGFKHLDFETDVRMSFLSGDSSIIRRRVAVLQQQGRDVVISWGFVPDVQLDYVLLLRDAGFRWIWFDGDRERAHREYLSLGRAEADWARQLRKIEASIDPVLDTLAPQVVDTFSGSGRRDYAEIAAELLRPAP
jgi:hypothetical protein